MDALILFSHGSLLCGAGEALETHAARLRNRSLYSRVEIGYLNYSEPPFSAAVDACAASGATRIIVAPYFLVSGYFVSKSLPEQIATARAQHPHIEFVVAEALNYADALADALWESALNAEGPEHWREPLARAAAACRPSKECPLYGTPACPKVPTV